MIIDMKKYRIFFLIVTVALFSYTTHKEEKKQINTCIDQTKNNLVRYGMVTGVSPDKLAHYKDLHTHPWPEVMRKINECNIKNYSIYLQQIDRKYYLFSYFEYVGNDFDADMKKMAADTATQRWWRETDPCQIPLPEAAAKKEIWTKMEEVFHEN